MREFIWADDSPDRAVDASTGRLRLGALSRVMRCAALAGACSAVLAGCGTSTVQLTVVRPAPINAQTYGGTVSVADFIPTLPDYAEVAGQMKLEIADFVARSVGGAVRLQEYGGGLTISGQIDEYAVRLTEAHRNAICTDQVRVGDGKEAAVQEVERPCTLRWYQWVARAVVTPRIVAASGQLLFQRPMVTERRGRTAEVRDAMPPLPDSHHILQDMRRELAQEIAWLVVPHLQRVTAVVYDCREPATKACEQGAQAFADSRHDAAIGAYTQALAHLEQAHAAGDDRAKVLWNRALVFQFSRRFDEAIADLRGAYQLDPEDAYREQVVGVERERALHRELLQQGLGPQGSAPAEAASPPPAVPAPPPVAAPPAAAGPPLPSAGPTP